MGAFQLIENKQFQKFCELYERKSHLRATYDSRIHPIVSTEKTEKDSAHLKKDVQKTAGPTSPEDTGKKAKSHTLMQEAVSYTHLLRIQFVFCISQFNTNLPSIQIVTQIRIQSAQVNLEEVRVRRYIVLN